MRLKTKYDRLIQKANTPNTAKLKEGRHFLRFNGFEKVSLELPPATQLPKNLLQPMSSLQYSGDRNKPGLLFSVKRTECLDMKFKCSLQQDKPTVQACYMYCTLC